MKHAAFTLVELLTVIFIIVLLMSILLPSLQQSKQTAKAVVCGSSIKQLITSGFMMYESENGFFPQGFNNTLAVAPPGGYPGSAVYDRMGWWWFNYIVNYSRKNTGADSTIWCPSRQINDRRFKDNVLCGNYGVNQSICKSFGDIQNRRNEFIGTSLSYNDIPRPGETLLLMDSGYSIINWYHVTDFPPTQLGNTIEDAAYVPGLEINKKRKLWQSWPGMKDDAIYGRHPNKTVNVGFADGHVNRIKADDLFVEKTGNTYKNLCPLWLPK